MPQDNLGALNTWVERAIAPKNLVDEVKKNCNLSYVGPLRKMKRDAVCNAAISNAMNAFTYVNIYNIYADICTGSNSEMTMLRQLAKVSWFHESMFEHLNRVRRDLPLPPFDPCIGECFDCYTFGGVLF
jgi:hypothetical protein